MLSERNLQVGNPGYQYRFIDFSDIPDLELIQAPAPQPDQSQE